jgi:probable HAF family extracellular repeat protein
MSTMHTTNLSKRRLLALLPCLLGGAVLAGTAPAGQPQAAAAGQASAPISTGHGHHHSSLPAAYRVINLGPGEIAAIPRINDRDQVSFSFLPFPTRALFYDGSGIQDLGSLGGADARSRNLNNLGQVVGFSNLQPGDDPNFHGFVWRRTTGIVDIGALSGNQSFAVDINDLGEVTGSATLSAGNQRAIRWTPAFGLHDLGLLPGAPESGSSTGTAIGESGLIVGTSTAADGNDHATVWRRKAGPLDLGTLGGETSSASAVNASDQVVGGAAVAGGLLHAFLWEPHKGMRDLGTGTGQQSIASAISDRGQVIGGIAFAAGGEHGFSWTRSGGLVDLGTLGRETSTTWDVNDKGQVVGGSPVPFGPFHAYVWTASDGMVDLNARLRHAPAGLVLDNAFAISANGAIVATSNAGLVLLKPDCGCPGTPAVGRHSVGPIVADPMVAVGARFDATVSFASADPSARHNVSWSWGDGSGEQAGHASQKQGTGSATSSHSYAAPGIYTARATVTDLKGERVSVTRQIVVYDKAGGVLRGGGSFLSPRGADRSMPHRAGPASFRFVAAAPPPSGSKASAASAQLQFEVGSTNFRSTQLKAVALQGTQARFEGSGTINGTGDYRFTLVTSAGANGKARFGMKLWHSDPLTRAAVADYDNLQAGMSDAGAAVQGNIVHQL